MVRLALAALAMTTTLSGCAAINDVIVPGAPPQTAQMTTLEGMVRYRERIALPPDARVTVTIEDVSRADAPAITVATTNFLASGQQVPLRFQLSYDAAQLTEGNRYSVSARIVDGAGRLMWITDTFNALPVYGRTIDLNLVRTRS